MLNSAHRNKQKNRSRSRSKNIWTWAIGVIILICIYIGIFHAHRYYGFDMMAWIVIIGILAFYALDMIWFEHGKWHKLMSFLFVIFVGGPIALLVIFLHNIYIDKSLSGHEVSANGIVKKLYVAKGKNSRTPYAIFTYQVNDEVWTQKTINNQGLAVGDTVKIICSELDPEIFVFPIDL